MDNGLPVTRVISRVLLQEKLAEAARRYGGDKIIQNDCHVTDFEEVLCPVFASAASCRLASRYAQSADRCMGRAVSISGLRVRSKRDNADLLGIAASVKFVKFDASAPSYGLSRSMCHADGG